MERKNPFSLFVLSVFLLVFSGFSVADEDDVPPPGTMLGGKPNTHIEPTFTPIQRPTVDKQAEIEDFVKKAYDFVQAKGKKAAFDEFNKKDGLFTDGSVYIFVIDYKGNMLANGYNQDMVGKNLFDKKDIEGKLINRALIVKAKSGGGWELYRWTNPVSNLVECKRSYALPMEGDYLISAGYYFPPNLEGKCELP
jgi:hypothetical protein